MPFTARCASVPAVFLVLCTVVLWCGPVAGYPTSLNIIPTADSLEAGHLRVEWERDGYPGLFGSDAESYFLLQAGLTDRLEAGLDLYHWEGSTSVALNAKCLLAQEGRLPAVAIGILDVGNGLRPTSYVVLSRDAGVFRLHGGAARANGVTRGILGAEYELRPRVYLLADWQAGYEGYATLGAYVEGFGGAGLNIALGFPNSHGESNLLIVDVIRRFSFR